MQGGAGNLDPSTVTTVKASDLVLASRSEIHSVERAINSRPGLATFEPMEITKVQKILLDRQVQIECLCLKHDAERGECVTCLLYTSPSPRDRQKSRMPSSA